MSHIELLDKGRVGLLRKLTEDIDVGEVYMAGGTALSLQFGFRKSIDFDFFVPHRFNADDLLSRIKNICSGSSPGAIRLDNGTCSLSVDGIRVSYFYHDAKMVNSYIHDDSFPALYMASPRDIASMKAMAVGSGGSKKDFFDLYFIMRTMNLSACTLAKDLRDKYGTSRDFSYVCMGMSFFDRADAENLTDALIPYDWDEMKAFFLLFQRQLFSAFRELDNACGI